MKFGRTLVSDIHPDYRDFCIAYRQLKKAIKQAGSGGQTIQDITSIFGQSAGKERTKRRAKGEMISDGFRPSESRFHDLLTHELSKVERFASLKFDAVQSELKKLTQEMDKIEEYDNKEKIEKSFELLKERVSRLPEDVVGLHQFCKLNYSGFRKITKKFDKAEGSCSSTWFMASVRRSVFMNLNFDSLLELLSILLRKWEKIQRKVSFQEEAEEEEEEEEEERVSPQVYPEMTSFWVTPESSFEVKVALTEKASRGGEGEKEGSSVLAEDVRMTFFDLSSVPASACGAELSLSEQQSTTRFLARSSGGVEVSFEATAEEGRTSGEVRVKMSLEEVLQLSELPEEARSQLAILEKKFSESDDANILKTFLEAKMSVFEIHGMKVEILEDIFLKKVASKGEEEEKFVFPFSLLTVPKALSRCTWFQRSVGGRGAVTEVAEFSLGVHSFCFFYPLRMKNMPPWFEKVVPKSGSSSGDRQSIFQESGRGREPLEVVGGDREDVEERKSFRKSLKDEKKKHKSMKSLKNPREVPFERKPRRSALVRVEPKSFFSNERVFLDWLHTAFLLGSSLLLACSLLEDAISLPWMVLFCPVPAGLVLSALLTYSNRVENLKEKRALEYEDKFAPPILTGVLLASQILVFLTGVTNLFSAPSSAAEGSAVPLAT